MRCFDVAVVGGGPAGTALTAALVAQGLETVWIAPNNEWSASYGLWVDGLTEIAGADIFEHIWDHPIIATDSGIKTLSRSYGRIDNRKLRGHLDCGGAVRILERVVSCEQSEISRLSTPTGMYQARLVFDCTGPKPALTARSAADCGYQTAYGVVAELEGEPLGGHDMALMDYRSVQGWNGPPTFLYAMRLPNGRWFLEETVLVARPPVPVSELKSQLFNRLSQRGIEVLRTFEEERCVIPMGESLPVPGTGFVHAFGASASLVHPATGYMLARVLNQAPQVAEASAGFIETGVNEVTASIWPQERRATRELFLFGMETLIKMDARKTHAFFDAFFDLPESQWRGYLDDNLPPKSVAATMLNLFGKVGLGVKSELVRSTLSQGQTARILRAFKESF